MSYVEPFSPLVPPVQALFYRCRKPQEGLPPLLIATADNVEDILRDEVGKVFAKVLEHAGVFKCDELEW